jgi:hypothetical protein
MGNDFTTIVYKPRNAQRPYAVRWRIDGRQHERSFATQAEAEKYKLELDYRRSSGTYIDPAKTEQLFKDAVEDWLTSAPRTIANDPQLPFRPKAIHSARILATRRLRALPTISLPSVTSY